MRFPSDPCAPSSFAAAAAARRRRAGLSGSPSGNPHHLRCRQRPGLLRRALSSQPLPRRRRFRGVTAGNALI
ncbi:unnamed protein product [Urochloa humidicola]